MFVDDGNLGYSRKYTFVVVKSGVIKMKYSQNDDKEPDYTAIAAALFDEFAPAARQSIDTAHLPDEVVDSEDKFIAGDLKISDQSTGTPVADIEYIGTGELIITVPADYSPPMHRNPFDDIDDPDHLPPSGQLIYEIMELVNCIILSTYPELRNQRKVITLVEQLHQNHSYEAGDISERLVEEAQIREDLSPLND